MKKILVYGLPDKRVVLYPLVRILESMGTVMVFTEDTNCIRLNSKAVGGKEFEVGLTHYKVIDIGAEISTKEEDADYLVEVRYAPIGVVEYDSVIYVYGEKYMRYAEEEEEETERLLTVTPIPVFISMSSNTKKLTGVYPLNQQKGYMYVEKCDIYRSMVDLQDAKFISELSAFLPQILELSIDEFQKIMKRKAE